MNWQIILLSLLFQYGVSLRILAVFPTVTRSHYMPGRRIMMELLKRGHEVVSISPFEEDGNLANFTWIRVEVRSFFEAVPDLRAEINRHYNFFTYQAYVWRTMNTYANYIVNRPKLRSFIENDESKFDLILAEEFFLPIFYAFAHKYRAPMAIVTTYGVAQYVNEFTGNPLEMSSATQEFLDFTVARNIYERTVNLVCTMFDIVGRRLLLVEYQDRLARDVFKSVPDLPYLSDMERNVDLVLVNSHYSIMDVIPNLPNVVEIGGVHIEDVKPLEQEIKCLEDQVRRLMVKETPASNNTVPHSTLEELQSVLDGATKGAILFSFGSILNLDSQSDSFVHEILAVLGELKQRVIIKWDSDRDISKVYKNVFSFKWLPQNDVLAHHNVVLFISHGGLLSLYEAIYHKVPIICIPLQASQPKNCLRVNESGLGVRLNPDGLTSASLKDAITKVLDNPAYRFRIEAVSTRFRDRIRPPLDTAIYWIEHCARFRGIVKRKLLPTINEDFFHLIVALIVIFLTVVCVQKLFSIRLKRYDYKNIINRFS